MIFGFTGTRKGMTEKQKGELWQILSPGDTLRFGDAIGADKEAFVIAQGKGCQTIAHPGNIANQRAFCPAGVVHAPKAPLERNQDIVNQSDALIAAPAGEVEELRSGTWATIRYARKVGQKIFYLWP